MSVSGHTFAADSIGVVMVNLSPSCTMLHALYPLLRGAANPGSAATTEDSTHSDSAILSLRYDFGFERSVLQGVAHARAQRIASAAMLSIAAAEYSQRKGLEIEQTAEAAVLTSVHQQASRWQWEQSVRDVEQAERVSRMNVENDLDRFVEWGSLVRGRLLAEHQRSVDAAEQIAAVARAAELAAQKQREEALQHLKREAEAQAAAVAAAEQRKVAAAREAEERRREERKLLEAMQREDELRRAQQIEQLTAQESALTQKFVQDRVSRMRALEAEEAAITARLEAKRKADIELELQSEMLRQQQLEQLKSEEELLQQRLRARETQRAAEEAAAREAQALIERQREEGERLAREKALSEVQQQEKLLLERIAQTQAQKRIEEQQRLREEQLREQYAAKAAEQEQALMRRVREEQLQALKEQELRVTAEIEERRRGEADRARAALLAQQAELERRLAESAAMRQPVNPQTYSAAPQMGVYYQPPPHSAFPGYASGPPLVAPSTPASMPTPQMMMFHPPGTQLYQPYIQPSQPPLQPGAMAVGPVYAPHPSQAVYAQQVQYAPQHVPVPGPWIPPPGYVPR